ncbi:hypothetical protein [Nostoc sp. MS1]|uniref:hypothetical protein n=1 Tax=Nostoc sp. MS1 TaxID=2764711 RepID=UPI001CC4ACC1|nr:hypothetical protein [Nostoc sp. MS1]BCL34701.1 hypothetical protein NSMS1_11480 [Nostoc sp. MS1]
MLNSWFRFWWYWLIIVTSGVIIFSLSLLIAPGFMQNFFDAMFFSTIPAHTNFSNEAYTYIKFLYGLLGAVMIGWSVALFYILWQPFRHEKIEGWFSMLTSVVAWFSIDTSFSLASGFWQNAVLNVAFFILFMIPLAATYTAFKNKKIDSNIYE